MNNIQFKFSEIMPINCKRKLESEEDIDNSLREKEIKRRRDEQYENGNLTFDKGSIHCRRNIQSKQTYKYKICKYKCKYKCW